MAGVRIQHATARSARLTVAESKPYPSPYTCTPPEFGGCGSVHVFKTHHLTLDETGAVILGDVLYKKLKPLLSKAGFTETNVVKKPPTQGIGLGPKTPGAGSWGDIPIIHTER